MALASACRPQKRKGAGRIARPSRLRGPGYLVLAKPRWTSMTSPITAASSSRTIAGGIAGMSASRRSHPWPTR